jgi:tetratricopeptide (TPR) repeat protein
VAASAAKALRPDRGFAVWLQGACALTCAGNYQGALDLADRAIASTESVPVLLIGCLAAKAHLLARTGRHDEAAEYIRRVTECAERLDDPRYLDTARIDAGLVALAAGRYREAASLLAEGLAGDPMASRPSASLACAEALVAAGDPVAAQSQLRSMVTEPAGRADQPWALVPKMARVQGLIAAATGRYTLARKRFDEAERGWRRVLASVTDATVDGYLAAMVDLGRPPVVGLVEPKRELARLHADRAALDAPESRTVTA